MEELLYKLEIERKLLEAEREAEATGLRYTSADLRAAVQAVLRPADHTVDREDGT